MAIFPSSRFRFQVETPSCAEANHSPKVARLIIAKAPWAPHQGWSQPLVLQARLAVRSASLKWKSSALLAVNPGQATKLQLSKTNLQGGRGDNKDKAAPVWRGGPHLQGEPTLYPELQLHSFSYLSLLCPSEVRAAAFSPILQIRKLRLGEWSVSHTPSPSGGVGI